MSTATGSVSEASSSILDGFASSGREWDEYFEELYGGIVTIDKIEEFAKEYRGSEEEKKDLIEIYNDKQGDMDEIMVRTKRKRAGLADSLCLLIICLFRHGLNLISPPWFQENLMLADTENEPRLRTLIESLFSASLLTPTPLWKKTTTKSAIKKRTQEAHTEAKEAEQHAKELGLHDKLSKASGKTDEEKLMALIKANSERRMGALISNLEAKYAKPAKKGKGKKAREEESEEENVEEEVVEVKKKAKKAKA